MVYAIGWSFNLAAIMLVAVLTGVYYRAGTFRDRKLTIIFCLAIVLLLVVTTSPLHALAMRVYFSAHMVVHVVLLLVCGPLLVAALPVRSTSHPTIWKNGSVFLSRHLWLTWLTGVGVMWLWHIPAVFDATMQQKIPGLQAIQLWSLVLSGMIFSWPVIGPYPNLRIHPLTGILYLAIACASCSLLGLLITFAPSGTYRYYPVLPGVTRPWQLSSAEDQQFAGLIMWVPCCLVYLTGCLWQLLRWFGGSMEKLIKDVKQLEHTHGK